MNIELVYARPEKQQIISMTLVAGTNARTAILQAINSGLVTLADEDATLNPDTLPIGVYGKVIDDRYLLQEGDRLEIYRPLLQDPKERRRQLADQKSSA